jgi:hypothetical protein
MDWSRASLDLVSVPSPGGQKTGPNPTDRGKSGSKCHLMVDRNGVPLTVRHSAANVHDSKMLEEAVDAVRPTVGHGAALNDHPIARRSFALTKATISRAAKRP